VCLAARPLGVVIRPLGDTLVLNPPLSLEPAEARLLVDVVGRAISAVLGAP
jgi:adenosylmethionine-8-amino-7-oxononanoate aminotransferase